MKEPLPKYQVRFHGCVPAIALLLMLWIVFTTVAAIIFTLICD